MDLEFRNLMNEFTSFSVKRFYLFIHLLINRNKIMISKLNDVVKIKIYKEVHFKPSKGGIDIIHINQKTYN